jgi:BON domain
MAETMFGSVTPLWPPMFSPALGWFQTPMPAANRPVSGVPNGMSPSSQGVPVAGSLPWDLYGLSSGTTPGAAAAYPAFNGIEMGPSAAPALVTAVAIRRGQPIGPTNDQEIEDFMCDVLDLLPGANDVEVRCDSGRAVLTGTTQHKRVKRDAGEIAWAIPGISDVHNNITITPRRRSRSSTREAEPALASAAPGRKQA